MTSLLRGGATVGVHHAIDMVRQVRLIVIVSDRSHLCGPDPQPLSGFGRPSRILPLQLH